MRFISLRVFVANSNQQLSRHILSRSPQLVWPTLIAMLGMTFAIGLLDSSAAAAHVRLVTKKQDAQSGGSETEAERAIRLFNEGKFDDSISLAKLIQAGLSNFSTEEKWQLLIIAAQMEQGDYAKALETVDAAIERFPNSIRIRWVGEEVCRFNGQTKRALVIMEEMRELVAANRFLYRDSANQILLGKLILKLGGDAKGVLDDYFFPVRKREPKNPAVYLAIGELAMAKHDYGLAAENFLKLLELQPKNTDAIYQLATAYQPSDSEKMNAAVQSALKINKAHVPCLLLVADGQISSENYEDASNTLNAILEVNPKQFEAWAYKSVIAHLQNDPEKEAKFRNEALSSWQDNPAVDHIIGRELSEKYRFAEGEKCQRRALVYDRRFLPAKMQLANDLLRLGQEREGWELADEVFDADQYSVLAHNLVTLRDEISDFKTLKRGGFVVRMEAEEASIYGEQVLDLVTAAHDKLVEKYAVELESPIFIEIFPRQTDFAIRTFGIPGGAGFLGVCFGRVITMNSPAAQGVGLTSWESVLWHEFCHVVTLQKTKNKMPRWLSEGISVYEEKLANPAWGDTINVQYREMIFSEDLTPVSKLSGAFLRPKSPLHLQFAYYESSLVVEYIIKNFGLPSLLKVLDDLSLGTPINDALRRHVAPPEFIDKEFAKFAQARADSLAPDATWDKQEQMKLPNVEVLARWNEDHPDNLVGLMAEAQVRFENKEWLKTISLLERANQLSPVTKSPYPLLARAYREIGEKEKEFATLEKFAEMEADSVELFTTLLEVTTGKKDWEKVKKYATRLLALNPLLITPHRYLSIAAEKTNDDEALIQSLSVLAKMNPLDAADVHFRLASAHFRKHQLVLAKRQAMMALDKAPRYRDAHSLFLKIVEQLDGEKVPAASDKRPETPPAKKELP